MFIGSINRYMRAVLETAAGRWKGLPVYVACSGNFTVERILAKCGVGAIHSNDVSIYSCALGWHLANTPQRFVVKAQDYSWLEPYLDSGPATIATLLLAGEMLKVGGDNAYAKRMREEYRRKWPHLHAKTVERVKKATAGMSIASYFAGDCREFLADADKGAVCISFPPTYKGGYERLYKKLDAIFDWPRPSYQVFSPEDFEQFSQTVRSFGHWMISSDTEQPALAGQHVATVQTSMLSKPVFMYSDGAPHRLATARQQVGQNHWAPRTDEIIEPIQITRIDAKVMNAIRSQYLAQHITPCDAPRNYAVLSAGKLIGAFSFALPRGPLPCDLYLLSDFAVRPTPHSPRAIRQALRRRLLVLLIRQQVSLEMKRAQGPSDESLPRKIVELQDEMRALASQILDIRSKESHWAEADAYIAQMKQRLAKKLNGEITAWALDGDEDADDVILAETTIPNESKTVRELLRIVPDGTDRKFDTLVRAIEQVRAGNSDERFVIFTQYRETLEFLREELAKLYGQNNIAAVKGGPLDDKIAAVEQFWEPDGARFLVSTSAGGEGINLQVCRVLFNYDLPWNPMAVEQRIGRIHRYGQQDTVQVYNLIAEDTIEQRIYDLLEAKLLDIARTIGKVDPVTGSVAEDFRGEILGFIGSAPNYQELYRKAILDRDYQRTAEELAQMMQTAAVASQALQSLAQDLTAFNLEYYRKLQGELTLQDLKTFVETGILRLGGTFIPEGDFYRIETPQALLAYRNVAARYNTACFRRDIAMRRKSADFMGIGHPLVDALVAHFQRAAWPGDVAVFKTGEATASLSVRYILEASMEDGACHRKYESVQLGNEGSWHTRSPKKDVDALADARALVADQQVPADVPAIRQRVENAIADAEAQFRTILTEAQAVRGRLAGVAVIAT